MSLPGCLHRSPDPQRTLNCRHFLSPVKVSGHPELAPDEVTSVIAKKAIMSIKSDAVGADNNSRSKLVFSS